MEGTESHLGASQRNYKETQFISPRKITCVFYHCSMHEVWSQELQCYRTRNASLVGLKYTCFYPCSVRIVSGQIFRIFLPRPYAARERKPNISLDDLRRCCPLTQGHSAWLFSLFGSLYFTVCKNRYTHSLIIHRRLKKLNATVLGSNFLSNNSGILPILPSSESLRLALSFFEIFNRSFLKQ